MNFKMDLTDIRRESVGWFFQLNQERDQIWALGNTVFFTVSSVNWREYLVQLSDCQLHKKDSVPRC
jgi:hypothetical protein